MTTTHTTIPTLPTPAQYIDAVTAALVHAQETVEAITWRLREIVDAYEDSDTATTPTPDDIVAVFTLVDELDRTTTDLDQKRGELQDMMRRLNLARLRRQARRSSDRDSSRGTPRDPVASLHPHPVGGGVSEHDGAPPTRSERSRDPTR